MLCEYEFAPSTVGDEAARRELADWAAALLARHRANGQVWGPAVFGWIDGVLRATFCVPQPDALDSRHDSAGVTAALARVTALCAAPPAWRVLGAPGETIAGRVDAAAALFVRADMFADSSPVREGRDGTPVPLYLLPIDAPLREALSEWAANARVHTELWIRSGRLEGWAYRELSTPDSTLMREALDLARQLEGAVNLPTYVLLEHYWGRRDADRHEVCPSCAGPWMAGPSDPEDQGIDGFAFRCAACRLVSTAATVARAT